MIPFSFLHGGKGDDTQVRLLCYSGTAYYWKVSQDGGTSWSDEPSFLTVARTNREYKGGRIYAGRYALPGAGSTLWMSVTRNSGFTSNSYIDYSSGTGTLRGAFLSSITFNSLKTSFYHKQRILYGSQFRYNGTNISSLIGNLLSQGFFIDHGGKIWSGDMLSTNDVSGFRLSELTSGTTTFTPRLTVVANASSGFNRWFEVVGRGRLPNQIIVSARTDTGSNSRLIEINNMNTSSPSIGSIYSIPSSVTVEPYTIIWYPKISAYVYIGGGNANGTPMIVYDTRGTTERLSVPTYNNSKYYYTVRSVIDSLGRLYLIFLRPTSGAPYNSWSFLAYRTEDGNAYTQVFTGISSSTDIQDIEID